MLQSHCGDNQWEALFSWLHTYYAHLTCKVWYLNPLSAVDHFWPLLTIYIYIISCDYLNKSSMKTNVATDEGNSRNEMWQLEHLNGFQWSWVQISLGPTFYSYFKESFSDEYHIYQLIPPHSCDYLNKSSMKTNVATDEGNSRNEMWHWANDEIGVAVQSWLWVRVELMAW